MRARARRNPLTLNPNPGSALTEEAEAMLYDLCEASGITTISVGHRASVRRLHTRVLLMDHGGKWSLAS